jgi:16S rRNA (adenine1518-N6/adenine1519-N6)-dimethyltransferase
MRARKRFAQHFLSADWARKVVAAIAPAEGDTFLEIGPGAGAITLPLAEAGARVVAIEIDRDLARELRAHAPGRVQIVESDVLRVDLPSLLRNEGVAPPVRIAANLPYNVSSPILFRLLEAQRAGNLFTDATLMLQREVADRLVAGPGTKDYGVLSIFTQLQADVRRLLDLPPGAFRPAPNVRSSVLRLVFHPPSPPLQDFAAFERLVKGLFQQRRKTVLNALRAVTGNPDTARRALERAGVDPRRRPETLSLAELVHLSQLPDSSQDRAVL